MRLIFILSLGLFALGLSAQEIVKPLDYNPFLLEHGYHRTYKVAADTLELPFKDDFSVLQVYPDSSKWIDNDVVISADIPVEPVSIGAAVFDGLDNLGRARSFGNPSGSAFADELTSKPLNMDLDPADSIYLSFYFQEKGLGNGPESSDSLVLDFTSPSFGAWTRIWSTGGGNGVLPFKQVMIPITDTNFLENGFQFRFRNYGSLAGNLDHWSVDYVFLDANRTHDDTIPNDVTFVKRPRPYFKSGLRAMPWSHFRNNQQELRNDTFFFDIRNRSDSLINVDYRMEFSDMNGYSYVDITATDNAQPLSAFNKKTIPTYSMPAVAGVRNDLNVRYFLKAGQSANDSNDFINERVVLNDYYAYDDGTAEAAYGLQGANGRVAIGFTVPQGIQDSVAGLLVHFAQLVNDVSNKDFSIGLYESNGNDEPGNLIHEMTDLNKAVGLSFHNGFSYIPFDTTLVITGNSGGTRYFITLFQPAADPIHIGLDYNSLSNQNTYYSYGGGNWNQSLIPGAVMMRPVMGNYQQVLEIEEQELKPILVYPNPATEVLYVDAEEDVVLTILNLQGQELRSIKDSKISLNGISAGLYLIQLADLNGRLLGTYKFIKQ